MRVFKLLQDLPGVQAGELFVEHVADETQQWFEALNSALRYDVETVASNPLWFQEVEAIHAEFEKLKQEAQALVDKLLHLQANTPEHINVIPAVDRVNEALTHLEQTQAELTPTPDQVAPAVNLDLPVEENLVPQAADTPIAELTPEVPPVDIPVEPQPVVQETDQPSVETSPEPLAPQADIPASVQEAVEPPPAPEPTPEQPAQPEIPPVVTNIEPNPFA